MTFKHILNPLYNRINIYYRFANKDLKKRLIDNVKISMLVFNLIGGQKTSEMVKMWLTALMFHLTIFKSNFNHDQLGSSKFKY